MGDGRRPSLSLVAGTGYRGRMKTILMIAGGLVLAMGLLWIGQGTGLVDWPRASLMIDQRPWAWRGAILAVSGAALIWYARRR